MKVFHGMGQTMRASVVTIGMFDGVHAAHRKILETVVREARRLGVPSVVVTFEGHPETVLGRRKELPLITTVRQRVRLFRALGIDRVMLIRFDKSFAGTSAEDFVETILVRRLGMKALCVGHDFMFGRGKKGGHHLLQTLSRQYGFSLTIIPPVRMGGAIVSSTRVRHLLRLGECMRAKRLLRRYYSMEGVVERGIGLGTKLGFPTANIATENDVLLPEGVYAVFAHGIGTSPMPGVLNCGIRPTIKKSDRVRRKSKCAARSGARDRVWELHLWNFHGSLYGKRLAVDFVKFLRPERKFRTLKALTSQIWKDIEKAKRSLKTGRLTQVVSAGYNL